MINGLNHLTLAVQDIDTSFTFYQKTLGFKPLVKWDKGAYFLVGEVEHALWFCLNVDPNRVPNSCYTHYAFSVSQEKFEQISAVVMASGATVFKDNSSPGNSLYFLDPDGHKLEIHVGDWQTRIAAKKEAVGSWKNIEWFL